MADLRDLTAEELEALTALEDPRLQEFLFELVDLIDTGVVEVEDGQDGAPRLWPAPAAAVLLEEEAACAV
jgi:hypothetical protein